MVDPVVVLLLFVKLVAVWEVEAAVVDPILGIAVGYDWFELMPVDYMVVVAVPDTVEFEGLV